MQKTADLSIIIVNYNSASYLKKCLYHISIQTVAPREIFVVDNHSEKERIDTLVSEYPNARFIFNSHNTGFAAANNMAIKKAQSRWLALVNPDAYLQEDWIETMFQAIEQYPSYGSFGSRMLKADEPETLDGTGDVYHFSGLAWRRDEGCAAANRRLSDDDIFSPCAAAAIYLREAVLKVKGFDEQYFCYFEDVDLGFRLQLAGYPSKYIATAVVHHTGSATTSVQSDFSVYHGHRNLLWTFVKNMPAGLLWLLMPLHIMLTLITPFRFFSRGQFGLLCRAKFDGLKKLGYFISQRKIIASYSIISQRELLAKMNHLWWKPRARSNQL